MTDGSPAAETLAVRCCIAGGGPAGMMLGFLLARAGVDVLVLEKHPDFFRDFRGDTIHPSTLEVMYELGLLEQFLNRPHQELRELRGWIGDAMIPVADFSHLPTHCKFIALMPQWDFLDFLAQQAKTYANFRLRVQAEVIGLIEEGGHVVGVRARTPAGALEVRADLVVGADGRHSTVRAQAGLQIIDLGAPMDVLWMRLSQRPGDPKESMGRFDPGHVFVMIDRGDYWQCAFVIPKDGFDEVKRRGLDAFRAEVARVAPFMADRVNEIADWDHVKLLTVAVERLRQWCRPGLLCIGDAAHAMSPIGGIGINLAIQDAVATGNLLAEPLRRGPVTLDHLWAVQRRRELPTRITQRAQVFIQNRVIGPVLTTQAKSFPLPLPLRLLRDWPFLRRIPARIIGMGVRPEHVKA
ncbi:MAG: FAD-dependent oxidoreductase [Hyphomicrobiales bacterium]|nr:FAD-dependent oxidoreductase [Hyphomicrobiales bacterium]MBV8825850.1 FAD-dependent oxidoreductase [Hyphomicrobiales bacterium]